MKLPRQKPQNHIFFLSHPLFPLRYQDLSLRCQQCGEIQSIVCSQSLCSGLGLHLSSPGLCQQFLHEISTPFSQLLPSSLPGHPAMTPKLPVLLKHRHWGLKCPNFKPLQFPIICRMKARLSMEFLLLTHHPNPPFQTRVASNLPVFILACLCLFLSQGVLSV